MLIRFKKNDGTEYPQWEKEVLNNILNLKSKTNHKVEDSINNGPYLFFTNGEKTLFFNSYDFDGEHIIINTGGKADFRYYNGKFAASSDCLVVTSNICTAYVYYYLKKLIDVINDKYFTGSGLRHLNKKSFLKKVISIPCLEEQQKIADFLSAVDQKIEAQKSMVSDYEKLKKGIMQKIFNQEIKFKDDDGNEFPEWEESFLPNIAEIRMGQSPDSSTYNNKFEGLPLIQGNADILINRTTNPSRYTSAPTKQCDIGDIIMTVRAPVGYVAKALQKACIGRGVCAIKAKCNTEFLFQYLMFVEPKWKRVEQGSTFTAIGGDDLKKLKVTVPCLNEQKKIADCLSALDRKIESEKKILADLEELKKGLLQAIFNN